MESRESKPRFGGRLIGAISFFAVICSIVAFFLGLTRAEQASEATLREIADLLRTSIPESDLTGNVGQFVDALAEGNGANAVAALREGVRFYDSGPCLPHNRSAELSLGGAVVNCETSMRAVFTAFDGNNNGYFTVGGNKDRGQPGIPFKALPGRYPDCSMIYEALSSNESGTIAKVSFDCPREKMSTSE